VAGNSAEPHTRLCLCFIHLTDAGATDLRLLCFLQRGDKLLPRVQNGFSISIACRAGIGKYKSQENKAQYLADPFGKLDKEPL
jgi:hypothetical protein